MKDGEILRLVRVRFPSEVRPGIFLVGDLPVDYGQRVVAMSERGMAIGFINSQVYEESYTQKMGEILSIQRVATEDDLVNYKASYQKQRDAKHVFNQLAMEHELPMTLEDMEFTSQGKKNIFYYTAPTRVDFRAFLKALSAKLKVKIELRQIFDAKTRSSEIGPCGPDLCLFINSLADQSGKTKKCSESFCCLEDKDPFYEDKRSRLPKKYALISTHTGEVGKVLLLDFVKEEFEMLTDQGVVKRYVSELYKENMNKKITPFPKEFEMISYDNKQVIGKEKRLAQEHHEREVEYEKGNNSAKEFSEEVWKKLSL